MRKVIFFIFFIIPAICFGKFNIDSLKKELIQNNHEENYRILNKIISFYLQENLDSARSYAHMQLKEALILSDSKKIANAYLNISNVYNFFEDRNIVLDYAYEALEIYTNLDDEISIAYCYLHIASYYHNHSNFLDAHSFINKAIKIFEKFNDKKGLMYCYAGLSDSDYGLANYSEVLKNSLKSLYIAKNLKMQEVIVKNYSLIGELNLTLGNFEKAKEYLIKAHNMSVEFNFIWEKAISLYKLGNYYLTNQDLSTARVFIEKSSIIFRRLKYPLGEAKNNIYWANILVRDKKINEAIILLEYSKKIIRSYNHAWLDSEISQQLGELYLIKGEFDKAFVHILNALDLAKKIEAKDLVLNNYRSLAKYYENVGDHYNAYTTYKKYSDLKDSLFIKNQNDITDIQVEYYTNQIKEENELLQKDLAISKLEAERQKLLTTIFFLGLLIVTITSSMIYLLYRRNKKNNLILEEKIDLALKAQREQQQIIVHRSALNAMGEFTAGIAHEISQPVQNIILSLQQMELNKKSESTREKNDHTFTEIYEDLNRVQYAIDHIRLFSSRQQEEYSELFSVNDILNQAYRMVRKQYEKLGIKIHFSLESYLPELTGNPFKLEQVFINLLSNAKDAVQEKHRQSLNGSEKIISIENYQNKEQIIVKIKDNGSGIPPEIQSQMFLPFFTTKKLGEGQGLGLSIANEIVKEFGGFIEIHSEMGQGTDVTVYLPLKKIG